MKDLLRELMLLEPQVRDNAIKVVNVGRSQYALEGPSLKYPVSRIYECEAAFASLSVARQVEAKEYLLEQLPEHHFSRSWPARTPWLTSPLFQMVEDWWGSEDPQIYAYRRTVVPEGPSMTLRGVEIPLTKGDTPWHLIPQVQDYLIINGGGLPYPLKASQLSPFRGRAIMLVTATIRGLNHFRDLLERSDLACHVMWFSYDTERPVLGVPPDQERSPWRFYKGVSHLHWTHATMSRLGSHSNLWLEIGYDPRPR